MREILFRGKRLDNGEWAYGSLHIEWGETRKDGSRNKDYRILGMRGECYYVDPDTIGQYTGLTDRNGGQRIFEGDILEHHVQSDIIVCRGEVFWETKNGRWALRLNTMNPCFYMHNPEAVEVIGNIHDNPELLGGGE